MVGHNIMSRLMRTTAIRCLRSNYCYIYTRSSDEALGALSDEAVTRGSALSHPRMLSVEENSLQRARRRRESRVSGSGAARKGGAWQRHSLRALRVSSLLLLRIDGSGLPALSWWTMGLQVYNPATIGGLLVE